MRLSYILHSYKPSDVKVGRFVLKAHRHVEIPFEEMKKVPAEEFTALQMLIAAHEASSCLMLDGSPVATYNEPQVVRTYELYHATS